MAEIEEKEEEKEEKVDLAEEPREEADVDEYRKGEKEGEKKEEERIDGKLEERSDEFFDHMFDLLRRVADKLGVGDDEEDEDEVDETVEVEAEEEEVMAPAEDMKLSASSSKVAKLSAKIAALESRAKKQDTQNKLKAVVNQGMESLSAWSPDEDIRSKMQELAEGAKNPAKMVKTFVEAFKKSVPQTPPSTFEEFHAGMGESIDPEVMKFQAEGPEAFEEARKASEMYDELSERGVIHSSKAAFLSTNMKSTK